MMRFRIGKGRWLFALVRLANIVGLALVGVSTVWAQPQLDGSLESRVTEVIGRPEFRHATFGIEFLSLSTGQMVFAVNGGKLFTPGSAAKLLTEGVLLEALGDNYRFHTKVYRTGPVDKRGILKGDIVLVASGDPNLSSRARPDDTLTFENEDHTYGGNSSARAVPGNPLAVMQELARQIAARGIRQVNGRVLIDASLFPDGEPELGTGAVISSISVNDNLIDITVAPGSGEGTSANLTVSPVVAAYTFINRVQTAALGTRPNVDFSVTTSNRDGALTVTASGSFPEGTDPVLYAVPVPHPTQFAETALSQCLQQESITLRRTAGNRATDFRLLARNYVDEYLIAEHVSPPLSEEVKVTLKVSQNLHASMGPFLLGALVAHKTERIDQAGFDVEREFLQKAALDLGGVSQGDGAGGAKSTLISPDFLVRYLQFMSGQRDFDAFRRALPILGRDGTLYDIQTEASARGHVFAKTGTLGSYDALNKGLILNAKGLAGYLTARSGENLAFAVFVNDVAMPLEPEASAHKISEALGEIAAAAYETR